MNMVVYTLEQCWEYFFSRSLLNAVMKVNKIIIQGFLNLSIKRLIDEITIQHERYKKIGCNPD